MFACPCLPAIRRTVFSNTPLKRPTFPQQTPSSCFRFDPLVFSRARVGRWVRCDEVFKSRYKQVSAGYDDLVSGSLDCLDVKDSAGGVLSDVFDFVVDAVPDSETGLLVTLQSLQGVVEVVAAFNEENVWTKVGEEKAQTRII